MKHLIVGDFHIQLNNIKESTRLFEFINASAQEQNVDSVIFTGDIFHTHSVLRQEVIQCVQDGMSSITKPIFIIAGNHDGSSPHSVEVNALRQTLNHLCTIIDTRSGFIKHGNIVLAHFVSDNKDFLNKVNSFNQEQYLICHHTFDGATFENGYYAPHALDSTLVNSNFTKLIGGHIHRQQSFGRVFYVGTPRAVSSSEHSTPENTERKSIWLFDDESGSLAPIYTDHITKSFWKYSITEENDQLEQFGKLWKDGDDVRIQIHGSESFYEGIYNKYSISHPNVKFIPVITKQLTKTIDLEENSKSMDDNLKYYVFNVLNEDEQTKEKVWQNLQALMHN